MRFADLSALLLGTGGLLHVVASSASACPYSIRDSAFVGPDRLPAYRLVFLIDDRTAVKDEISDWVSSGADAWLTDTNIRAEVLNLDRQDVQAIRDSLGPTFPAAEKLPAAVLVSPENDALLLSTADGPFTLDSVMEAMASVIESPARKELQHNIVKAWCVALLIEGTDPARNDAARKAIAAASERITGTTTELGKVVTRGPHLVTVSATDPAERILLWSLGIGQPPADAGAPRVAMVLGRAERRGPILEGEKITDKTLFDAFEMLGRSCSCTTSPTWLTGPALPLEWNQPAKDAIQDELGFDPNDPQAIDSIKGVLAGGGPGSGTGRRSLGLGYREMSFSSIVDGPRDDIVVEDLTVGEDDGGPAGDEADSPVASTIDEPANNDVSASPLGVADNPVARTGNIVVIAMAATALLAMVAMTRVILKRRQHA